MRLLICSALLAISACAIPPILGPRGNMTASTYVAADASTSLLVGDQLAVERFVSNEGAEQGMDPLVRLTLRHADGRTMNFAASNHTPHDVMAQAAGGPLAQVMGLMGEEAPTLYAAERAESANAFFCAPNGPSNIGVYEASDGTVLVVGMLQSIEFETRVDGSVSALPYSPDQVCARLRFRRG
jgi:hypothetical protein